MNKYALEYNDPLCKANCSELTRLNCIEFCGRCMQWWDWHEAGEPKPGTAEWAEFVKTLPEDYTG
jgi:hypothetical protein